MTLERVCGILTLQVIHNVGSKIHNTYFFLFVYNKTAGSNEDYSVQEVFDNCIFVPQIKVNIFLIAYSSNNCFFIFQ